MAVRTVDPRGTETASHRTGLEIGRRLPSAAIASKRAIATIRQGAIVLGTDCLRRLAVAASLSAYVAPIARKGPLLNNWKHSLATARAAKIIARELGKEQEKYFIAGLFGDIGLMGLMRIYSDQYSRLLAEHSSATAFLEAERTAFGVDHCELGASLGAIWHFPDEIQAVARYHHENPGTAGPTKLAVVYWADRLASAWDTRSGAFPKTTMMLSPRCPIRSGGVFAKRMPAIWRTVPLKRSKLQ